MKISEMVKMTETPELYTNGTSVMWTDPHISKQLLQIHLHPELDLASRKSSTIESTAKWVLSKVPKQKIAILDLGCGPGLYAEIFAKSGHTVTGVDFSENSIEYAKRVAQKKNLNINYDVQNYLELNVPENHYDLVTLIYTDLGVLNPEQRKLLITNVERVLKPGGTFIFDLLNDSNLEQKVSPKSWEMVDSGFWRSTPYLSLSESLLYKKNKVVLSQHTVIEEDKDPEIYRFWTHFFSHDDIRNLLGNFNFSELKMYNDILPQGDIWNGDNVTFSKLIKG